MKEIRKYTTTYDPMDLDASSVVGDQAILLLLNKNKCLSQDNKVLEDDECDGSKNKYNNESKKMKK